jgi:hypothetical protein
MPLRCSALLAAFALLAGAAHAAAPGALPLAAYQAQLVAWRRSVARLQSPAQARELAGRAPADWQVRVRGGRVAVPAAWLGAELRSIARGAVGVRAGRRQLSLHLGALARAAGAAPLAPAVAAARRRALQAILARREFASVHGPALGDEILAALEHALARLLGGFHGKSDTQALAWGIVVLLLTALVALLAVILPKSWRAPPRLPSEAPTPAAASWREWLRRAHALAGSGDGLACAVCAYQAGLAFGEACGWWPGDAAATPRELLHRLPLEHPARAAWRSLIAQFEALRYAGADADLAARRRLLGALEELGCR